MYSASFLIVSLFVGLLWVSGCKDPDPNPDPIGGEPSLINDSSWVVPIDAADTAKQESYYEFAWQSFVALNWPADLSYRGKPDMKSKIGALGPKGEDRMTVWQTWQEQYSIFLPGGTYPGQWNDLDTVCNGMALGRGLHFVPLFSKNIDGQVNDLFNEATGNPLIDMDSGYVRYEVRVCESEYQYFLNTDYYNALQQEYDVHNDKFVGMPKGNDSVFNASLPTWARFGSTEVKASWRIIPDEMPEAQRKRYFRLKALLMDTDGNCTDTTEIGLTGLHILRLTPTTGSTWFWASFEQVDNIQPLKAYGGENIRPTFNTLPPTLYGDSGYSHVPAAVVAGKPLPPANPVLVSAPPFQQLPKGLDAINMKWAKALKGTPFEYYMLIGTVNPVTVGGESVSITGTTTASNGKTNVNLPPIYVNTSDMANSTMETYMYKFTKTNNCVICHAGGTPQFNAEDSLKINGSVQVFTFLFGQAQDSTGVRNQ